MQSIGPTQNSHPNLFCHYFPTKREGSAPKSYNNLCFKVMRVVLNNSTNIRKQGLSLPSRSNRSTHLTACGNINRAFSLVGIQRKDPSNRIKLVRITCLAQQSTNRKLRLAYILQYKRKINIPLDLNIAKVFVFINASFTNNKDLSSYTNSTNCISPATLCSYLWFSFLVTRYHHQHIPRRPSAEARTADRYCAPNEAKKGIDRNR